MKNNILKQVLMLNENSNMTQYQIVHINMSYYGNKRLKLFATHQLREFEVSSG